LHDRSTRAQHNRHRTGLMATVAVAALFWAGLAAPFVASVVQAAQPPAMELSAIPATEPQGLDASPSHDIAIEIVAPGQEGLELSARLTDDGGLIELPMHWLIRNQDGETVYSGMTPGADVSVPPGEYTVDIRYDAVKLTSYVTLLEANRLMVSYVLNAGGMRILPRVKDVGLPAARPTSRIFALGGEANGRLVATSEVPGEIIRMPEGDYRIESRFAAGNAAAVVDVHVNAGKLSAVEIDHKAGLARLAVAGLADTPVTWSIRNAAGEPVAAAEGANADVVLLPGTYTASASVAGETLTATFQIASGEARDIVLGN
jgi:hypothetical protein